MKNRKPLIVILLLTLTLAASYAMPRVEYKGTGYINKLNIPDSFSGWKGRDVRKEVGLDDVDSDLYKFVSGAFASQYIRPDKPPLLFIILDAGNFHHPKVCFTGAGFEIKDMPDTEFDLPGKKIKVHTLFTKKANSENLSFYWIVIDKNIAHEWIEQKIKQLFFSIFGKKRVGLMVRIDIPAENLEIEEARALAQDFISSLGPELSRDQAEHIFGSN